MAALTSELDTNMITSKVKEILLQHNVGQKVSFSSFTSFSNFRKFSSFSSYIKQYSFSSSSQNLVIFQS